MKSRMKRIPGNPFGVAERRKKRRRQERDHDQAASDKRHQSFYTEDSTFQQQIPSKSRGGLVIRGKCSKVVALFTTYNEKL